MPSVISLKDCLGERKNRVPDVFFLVKEEDFPIDAVQLIQNQIKEFVNDEITYTKEEIIDLAETIIEEYGGTVIPFRLFLVSY